MPEIHTDRIFQLLESRLPAGDHLAMSDVLTGVLPPAVRAWLSAAVADRLATDLQAAPHLSRAAGTPAARRIGRGVVAALVPQYVIDRGDLLLLLRDAVEFVEAFLHRPRRTLEELLLGNAESVAITLLPSRLSIITDYTYLGIVLSRLLSEKTAADREELRRLIARVDDEVMSRHAPEELAQLMAPLLHWYELAGVRGIPVEAVLDFLDDKEMTALRDYVENIARIRDQSTLCATEIGSLAGDLARGAGLPIPDIVSGTPADTLQASGPEAEESSYGLNGAQEVSEELKPRQPEVSGTPEHGDAPSPGVPDVAGQTAEQEEVPGALEIGRLPLSGALEGTGQEAEQTEASRLLEATGAPSSAALDRTRETEEQDEVSTIPEPGGAPPSAALDRTRETEEQDEVSTMPEPRGVPPSAALDRTRETEEQDEVSTMPEPGGVPPSAALDRTRETEEQDEVSTMPEPGGAPPSAALDRTRETEEQEEVPGTPGTGIASSSGGPESGSPSSSGVPEAAVQSEEHAEASGAPEPGEVSSSGDLEQTREPALPAATPDVSQEEPPSISVTAPGSSTAQPNPERKMPAMRLPPEPEGTQGESASRLTPTEEKARRQEGYKGTIRRNFALALTSAGLKFGAPAAKPKPPLASEFSEEQRRLLIASLFRNEAAYFDNVVQTLAGLRSWRDGARYLTDFLEINRLNPYAKDVLQFTGIVRRWFVGDEEKP